LFYYFPNNYTWSSAVMLCLMAGGQLGQIDRWLASLRNDAPDVDAWATAWPFEHKDLLDRPADIFGGRTTVHTGGDAASWLQLPIVG
jgi:hypothetical protein